MSATAWQIRRRLLGRRQRDVADQIGISQSFYSLLERCEVLPSAAEVAAINLALELPAEVVAQVQQAVTPTARNEHDFLSSVTVNEVVDTRSPVKPRDLNNHKNLTSGNRQVRDSALRIRRAQS
jgi:transcriptional regulator with XRE-family HTH domain